MQTLTRARRRSNCLARATRLQSCLPSATLGDILFQKDMATILQSIDSVSLECDPLRLDIKALRTELREARLKNLLPRQEELSELAIGYCIEILTNWKNHCTCDIQYAPEELRKKAFQKRGGAKLCQSCKRASWALRLWIEIERILVERMKIEAGFMKSSLSEG